ncbi:MAG: MFS transporter [Actinomycetota bacterium]
MGEGKRPSGLRAALRHRDFALLSGAMAVSGSGNFLFNVTLIVYILDKTGSSAWVAAASIVHFLPYVLLGPIGGEIADRFDKRKVMIVADLGAGTAMVALTVAAATGGPALVAVVLSAVVTVFSALYFPSTSAATPALVGEDDLAAANTVMAAIENVNIAVGPALGGVLLLLGSPAAAFGVNAATFFTSAALTWPIRTSLKTESPERGEDDAKPSLGARLQEGVRAITGRQEIVLLVFVSLALMVFYGQELVLYALVAKELLGTGDSGLGFLFAATGVGGILVAGFAARLDGVRRQGTVLVIGTIAAGIPMIALAGVRASWLAYVLLTIEGAAFVVASVLYMTLLQRLLPQAVLGRVMGIMDSLLVSGIILGSLLAPIVVEVLGLPGALAFGGSLVIIPGAALFSRATSIDAAAEAKASELEPIVAVLERVGMFRGASLPTLEGLAQAAAHETVNAGDVLIREGAEPDDLYVIVSGTVVVTAAGDGFGRERVLDRIGPDGCVGEIGLLEQIPRTATVTAETDCEVLRIRGEEFLRIVTDGPGAAPPDLRAGVASRLAKTRPTTELGLA